MYTTGRRHVPHILSTPLLCPETHPSRVLEGKVLADIPPDTLVCSGHCMVMYKFLSKLDIHTLEPARVRGHHKL